MAVQEPAKKSVILDTDMSPDSWAAVLYLARHPNVELLAVSVSGTGEAHGKTGAINAARLLSLAGREAVRVGYGPPRPMLGSRQFPSLMRWAIDKMLFIPLPPLTNEPNFENSVEMITSILKKNPGPVTIAAVGPQTNLAHVLRNNPNLISRIESISVMGGAVDVPGNIREIAFWLNNKVAEWNFFCDPLAAKTVLSSGADIRLIPLDVTNQVPVTQGFVEALQSRAKSPTANFVVQVLKRMSGNFRREASFYLWDPMTCSAAVFPAFFQFEKMALKVVTEPGRKWASVIRSKSGTEIQIAKQINRFEFENNFMDSICGPP